jgi:DNA repair protein RadC
MRFTKRLLDAAQTLDIKILDHVIVAQDGFVSIRDMRHADHIFG